VSEGVTYTYYVTAVNSAGESDKSNQVQATPGSEVPELQAMWLIIILFIAVMGMAQKRKNSYQKS